MKKKIKTLCSFDDFEGRRKRANELWKRKSYFMPCVQGKSSSNFKHRKEAKKFQTSYCSSVELTQQQAFVAVAVAVHNTATTTQRYHYNYCS